MARPCGHTRDNPNPDCQVCKMAAVNPLYSRRWDGIDPRAAPPPDRAEAVRLPSREAPPEPPKWSYGLTTVPMRRDALLPRTLASLASGGFPSPRLFVDGCSPALAASYESRFKLPVTARYPTIRTYGNWVLALAELYIREPAADRYAMFQDDFVTYPNLRKYLERCVYPEDGYWNLYTFRENEKLIPAPKREGWFRSNQLGRGAVALVFSRDAVLTLLTHQHMVERPTDPVKGWQAVDGGVVTALRNAGRYEYVHYPSLVQHTGLISSMRNVQQQLAGTFRGEKYDATELVRS
jgi:hypothetical protein